MRRVVFFCWALVLLLVLTAPTWTPAPAQQPINPVQAAPAPSQQGGADLPLRNTTFDFVVAFVGIALVLLVVCYPSRRI